jgi:protein TonB
MEQKKHPKANLEQKKNLYSAIALLFTLAITLAAFEFRTSSLLFKTSDDFTSDSPFDPDDIMLIQCPKLPIPPLPKVQTNRLAISDNMSAIEIFDFSDIKYSDEIIISTSDINLFGDEYIDEEEIPPLRPDALPEFPGGEIALKQFLKNEIKYPSFAKGIKLSGKVYLKFTVGKDGSIKNIKILTNIGGGLEEEALRVVKKMPKWTPGIQHGREVSVEHYLPINFILR